ncbi:hypothetical protein GCM10029992_26580 [Glycomyces albus]
MGDRAPVDMVLIEFPGNEFKGEIVTELERLVSDRTIELLDLLLIRKEADGSVRWLEAEEAEDFRLSELVGEPSGLLAEEDAEAIAVELEPNSSVGMMIIEHTWAGGLAGAVRGANGRLIDWARVPAAAIDELASLAE